MDRGRFRGPRASRGGGGGRGGQGRGGSHQSSGGQQASTEKPKKENILDLGKFMNQEMKVKFNGGREGTSTMLLLVLADANDF
jgi:U6 snRNA-associated Sm-like protein LSm7